MDISFSLYYNTPITPTQGHYLSHSVEIQIAQNPNQLIQVRYFNPSNAHSVTTLATSAIPLRHRAEILAKAEIEPEKPGQS
jgi:ABC transport system ATP-binding/permease protein